LFIILSSHVIKKKKKKFNILGDLKRKSGHLFNYVNL
jgi:hypothetical protein